MNTRLLFLAAPALLLGISQPVISQANNGPAAAEQRLIDDRRNMPVPEDAHFSELMTRDLVMMMGPGGSTDDPQGVYPEHRFIVFAIPRSCSALEAFYKEHWPGFEFLTESEVGRPDYQAFMSWKEDGLHQLQVNSMEEIDDSAEGVVIMATDHSPAKKDSPGLDPSELTRSLYGIPENTDWCSVLMVNMRKVDILDIPLTVRGLSAGEVYSSLTGLFQVIVPTAENFFVDRYSVAEAGGQEGPQFVEDVSFLIGDFGELYRVGVIQHVQKSDAGQETSTMTSSAESWAHPPLIRHFEGTLPGDVELISAQNVATDYGVTVQALYRVEGGSILVHVTLDPIEASSPGHALVAVSVVAIGDYLVFATAQNDYLASESGEDTAIASIRSKAASMLSLLSWSRDLPGDAELPQVMGPGMRSPHLEQCLHQFDTDDGMAFENTCDQDMFLQIKMNPDQEKVLEHVIGSGETLRIADEEGQYAFAACPDGYQADRPFEGDDLQAIWASQYKCLKRESR